MGGIADSGDRGGGRGEEGNSGQRMEGASHPLGCAGAAVGRMGSDRHHGAGGWQSFLHGLCCLAAFRPGVVTGAGGGGFAGALRETGSVPKPLVL